MDAAASPRKRHALDLFQGLPRRYDGMGALLSFGQDPRWRRAMVDAVDPRSGQRILDVATGTGMVAAALARRGAQVTGLDQSEAMMSVARARYAGEIEFVHGEAERLPFDDASFDALTFTYLLRYVDDPLATMRELARVVVAGGRIGMVEFGLPPAGPLRFGWRAHTRVGLPLLGRAVSDSWYQVGRFLGPNIERFHTALPDLAGLWESAGLVDVQTRAMSFGAGLVMWGIRDGSAVSDRSAVSDGDHA